MTKMRKKSTVGDVLAEATQEAVSLLQQVMLDADIKPELRVKCAENILERAYGRASMLGEGEGDKGIVQVILQGEIKEFGK